MERFKQFKYILISVLTVFILLFIALYFCSLSSEKNASRYLKQGFNFLKKEDYQDAYYNFSKVSILSKLYPISVYLQAKSADFQGDDKTAQKKYLIYVFINRDKYSTPYALWRLGQIYYNRGNKTKAKIAFSNLRKNYPDSEYGIASNYFLSKLPSKNEKRKKYCIEYMKNSPNGRYVKDVMLSLLSDDKIKFTSDERIVFAKTLYENGAYNRSVNILKEVPINLSWVYLIKPLDKLNSSSNVIKVGKKGLETDNSSFDEDSLNEALNIYVKHLPTTDKIKAWDNIYNSSNDKKVKAIALLNSANLSPYELRRAKKIKLAENFPESKFSDSVIYSLFMDALKNNKLHLALKYAKNYLKNYSKKEYTPSILYFSALIKKKVSDPTYKEDIDRLLAEYPHSYYAYRGYVVFSNKKFYKKRTLPISKKLSGIEFPLTRDKGLKVMFEAFFENDYSKLFDDFRIDDPVLLSWIEYKKGNRALSTVISRDYLKKSDKIDLKNAQTARKLAYPIYYADEINKYTKARNLSPYLFLALIKEESHFNPDIRSVVGATGLTQIMPSTALMVSGGKHYTIEELTNPKLNIDLGTRYFAYLMQVFSNREELCVLSYNSGPNAVKNWLDKDKDFDLMVETIPYKETKEYIKKVYTAYWNYLLTYGGVKI